MIWGWRDKNIKIEQNSKYHCPDCGEEAISFSFLINYIHVFWIPIFPIEKNIISNCDKCNTSYKNKLIPEVLQTDLTFLKPYFKTPPYLFTGPVLVLLFIVYAIFHYDGMTKYYYPNGKLEAKGKIVKGEMHGKWTIWDQEGNLESIQFYNHGLEDSIWTTYYEDGTVQRRIEYEDGIFQGKQTYYYKNGKIETENLYEDHRPNGLFTSYYETGQKREEGNYIIGFEEGRWNVWHENGQMMTSGIFLKGEEVGEWNFFSAEGKLTKKIIYSDTDRKIQELYDEYGKHIVNKGNGIYKEYYENGQKKQEGIYINGEYLLKNWWTETGEQSIIDGTGYQIIKNDKGIKISEGKYENSKQEGIWKYYSEQGVLLGKVNFKDGKLDGESKYYYESGEIYSEGNFANNEQDDLWIWYSRNGKKDSQVKFIHGKKEGEQLFWSPMTQKIVKREYYKNGELVGGE